MFDLGELLKTGESCEINKVIEMDDTVGNQSVYLNQLLSTSSCVETFVKAANRITERSLPEGFITIGYSITITHEEPSLLGTSVTFRTVLKEIEGNRLVFDISARDALGEILRGTFERAVVNRVALMDKATERAEKLRDLK
jgi:predicted thioesterase